MLKVKDGFEKEISQMRLEIIDPAPTVAHNRIPKQREVSTKIPRQETLGHRKAISMLENRKVVVKVNTLLNYCIQLEHEEAKRTDTNCDKSFFSRCLSLEI